MRKVIISFLILLIPFTMVYAGQEDICYHDNFQITYSSDEEVLRIFCDDCGESINFNIDANLIKRIAWN